MVIWAKLKKLREKGGVKRESYLFFIKIAPEACCMSGRV